MPLCVFCFTVAWDISLRMISCHVSRQISSVLSGIIDSHGGTPADALDSRDRRHTLYSSIY